MKTKYINDVLGKTAKSDLKKGTPMEWKFIKRINIVICKVYGVII
jgi:hypothetical protein